MLCKYNVVVVVFLVEVASWLKGMPLMMKPFCSSSSSASSSPRRTLCGMRSSRRWSSWTWTTLCPTTGSAPHTTRQYHHEHERVLDPSLGMKELQWSAQTYTHIHTRDGGGRHAAHPDVNLRSRTDGHASWSHLGFTLQLLTFMDHNFCSHSGWIIAHTRPINLTDGLLNVADGSLESETCLYFEGHPSVKRVEH